MNAAPRRVMALVDSIVTGKNPEPIKGVILGRQGMGKTSLAASINEIKGRKVLIADADRGTSEIDVDRIPIHGMSYDEILEMIVSLSKEDHKYTDLCFDSADTIQPIIYEKVLADQGAPNIEAVGGGFGKGYVHAKTLWEKLLKYCDRLREVKKMHIHFTVHATVRTVQDPLVEPYDEITMDLDKRANALLQHWADAVILCALDTTVVKKDAGFGKTRAKAHFGERVGICHPTPGAAVKNRFQIKEQFPLKYSEFWTLVEASRK